MTAPHLQRQKRYLLARQTILKQSDLEIDEALILKVHSLITGSDSGFRKDLGFHEVCNNGKMVYWPPSGTIDIAKEVRKLLAWYCENQYKLPYETLAAKLHWGLVKIHPFDDGNGRTARLMVVYILVKIYNDQILRRIEEYFEKNKAEYYDALDDGNCSYSDFTKCSNAWVEYFATVVTKSAKLDAIESD